MDNLPKKCWYGQPERSRLKQTRADIWKSIHNLLVGEKTPKLLLIKPKFTDVNMVKEQAVGLELF